MFPIFNKNSSKQYSVGTLRYTPRGLAVLFAWMLWGDFCFTLMEAVVPSILPLKLRSLESPNLLIGFIMTTLPAIFNFTITPIISFKSDRHRSKWGRRIPFILFTMPFMVGAMILIGFSDDIGAWVHRAFFGGSLISQAQVIIVLLAIFAACFDLFNMFVNTVYWYLFVDVVPAEKMGQFNGWFRVVGTLTSAFYNFFIFQFAESHMREIFLGAGLLYFVGFGLMCLNVKEGQYEPIDDGIEKPTFMQNFKVFVRDCYSMRFYWDIFLTYTCAVFGGCIMVFHVFFFKSLGLDLGTIGKIGGVAAITVPICLAIAGKFVDRWHPVRVTAYLAAFDAILLQFNLWPWIFVDQLPSAAWFLVIAATTSALFAAPFRALNEIGNMSRLMFLFPKDRYGQFNGALALVRAVALIFAGTLAGLYIDVLKHYFDGREDYAYRFNFLWMAPFTLLSFYFQYRTFRAWKRLGGEKGYQPPIKSFKLSELKPLTDEPVKVEKKLLYVTGWYFLGLQLAALAWAIHFWFYNHNATQSFVFIGALGVNALLFFIYFKIIHFMERP